MERYVSSYFATVVIGFLDELNTHNGYGRAREPYVNNDIGGNIIVEALNRDGLTINGRQLLTPNSVRDNANNNRYLNAAQGADGLVHTRQPEEFDNSSMEQIYKVFVQELYGDGAFSEAYMLEAQRAREEREENGEGEREDDEFRGIDITYVNDNILRYLHQNNDIGRGYRGAYFGINSAQDTNETEVVGPSLVVMTTEKDRSNKIDDDNNININVLNGTIENWNGINKQLMGRTEKVKNSFLMGIGGYRNQLGNIGEKTNWNGIFNYLDNSEEDNLAENIKKKIHKSSNKRTTRMDCIHGMIRSIGYKNEYKDDIKHRHYEVSSTTKTTKSGACIGCAMYMYGTGHGFSEMHFGAAENWSLPWERPSGTAVAAADGAVDVAVDGAVAVAVAVEEIGIDLQNPNTLEAMKKYSDIRIWCENSKKWFNSGIKIIENNKENSYKELHNEVSQQFDQDISEEFKKLLNNEENDKDLLLFQHGQLLLAGMRLGIKVRDIIQIFGQADNRRIFNNR